MSESPAEAAPRLAVSQLRRIRRIVEATIALAEKGGFDGVRLRDVAEAADVSLGTLYKYFHSKEDVLLLVVNEEAVGLERVLAERPPVGGKPADRLVELFARATRGLTRRPDLARAVLRAVASSGADTAIQQAGFHLRVSRIVIAVLRGEAVAVDRPLSEHVGTEREQRIALVLEHVWYASLLGWANGLHPVRRVTETMRSTVDLLLEDS